MHVAAKTQCIWTSRKVGIHKNVSSELMWLISNPANHRMIQGRIDVAHQAMKLGVALPVPLGNLGGQGTDGPEKVVSALQTSYHLLADMRPLTVLQTLVRARHVDLQSAPGV